MKKIFILLISCLMLLCACTPKQEEEVKEPLFYSKDIRIVTKDLQSVQDLVDKKLAVHESFDREYSEYVLEQLANEGIELSEDNLVWFYDYAAIKPMIDEGEIDAWVIYDNREETINGFRGDYHAEDYNTLATYQKPYYEEKEAEDTSNLVKALYEEPFMVMIHGLDGYGKNSLHQWRNYRNDVNHLLVVNPQKKHVLIISIPRDTRIRNVKTGYYDKFTHFCQDGPQNPSQSLGEVLGVEIPYYCMTSFTYFVDGINKLGGVRVNVPMNMHLDMDSNRNVANPQRLEKGYQNLYGESALALARNRKYDGIVNNDMGRIRNQALIINSLIKKIATHPYILEMVGMSWLMDLICENNFSSEEKETLFALAKTFEEGYTIDNFFLDGEGQLIDAVYYVVTYEKNIEIAKGKIDLVMNGFVDSDSPYYEDIMKGYVSEGAGTIDDGDNGYIGSYYDLNDVFFAEKESE